MDDLVTLLADTPAVGPRLVDAGVVVSTSPLQVRMPGETVAVSVARTGGWTATVGATVVVLAVGSGLVAVGQVGD